jgi:hypothetical protein
MISFTLDLKIMESSMTLRKVLANFDPDSIENVNFGLLLVVSPITIVIKLLLVGISNQVSSRINRLLAEQRQIEVQKVC